MKVLLCTMMCLATVTVVAQGQVQCSGAEHEKPLPDIAPMMQKVIANERASEAMLPDYLVREWLSAWEGQGSNYSHGSSWRSVKGDEKESEVFWLGEVRVSRLVRVTGTEGLKRSYDHVLTPEELHKENARIDAEVATGNRGGLDQIRMSRLLELGTFSNPRWGKANSDGRDTIDLDYKGEQCSHECSSLDAAASKIVGVLTVDAEDKTAYKFDGFFTDTWIESGGEGWKVPKGSELTYWSDHREESVRFPEMMEVTTTVHHGSSFTTHSVSVFYREYKKFRVTSRVLPDVTLLPDSALHEAPPGVARPQ